MGVAEKSALRITYRTALLALQKTRDADRKSTNATQKTEVSDMKTRHLKEDKAVLTTYETAKDALDIQLAKDLAAA